MRTANPKRTRDNEIKIAIATGLAMGSMFDASSHASNDAPWCAVINLSMGDARWGCCYRALEECVPNVIAGDRGSCGPNPYGPAAVVIPVKRTYKHQVRHE